MRTASDVMGDIQEAVARGRTAAEDAESALNAAVDGALARARSFRWPTLVGAVYQDIAKRLTERPNGARPMIERPVDSTSGAVDVSAS